MASSTISVKGITKKFGELAAVDNVNLEINEGELFGLLGPNGAGKTTLISILSTLIQPTSGEATVCGHDVRREEAKVRRSIGIVFQDPSLDDELTGYENLDLHGRLYNLDAATRRTRIDEVLHLVELQDRSRDLVKIYSGGMRRRLEIARGLIHRPHVLFFDEPTLGLDPQTRRRIWNYIRELNQSLNMTMILTTHYMDEADQLCSRIGIVDHGKLVALDTPSGLKSRLGGDLLELEVAEPEAEFIELVSNSEDLADLYVEDHRLFLTVKRGESFIPWVFERAQAKGVEISSVSMRRPDLEDVFIQLTGRKIRDEGPADTKDRVRIFRTGKRR